MKNTFCTSAALGASLLLTANLALADTYWALDGSVVKTEKRLGEDKTSLGGRISIGGILSDSTDLEVGLFANPIAVESGRGGHQSGAMLDLVHSFGLGPVTPYVFVGGGEVRETFAQFSNVYWGAEGGLGLKFPLAGAVKARVSVSAMDVFNDKIVAGQDDFIDYRFNLGLMAPLGGARTAPAVAAVAKDSDGDGLADSADACPGTPAATANGCPPRASPVTDSDGDGVLDSADACPGTLAGLKVDARGCVESAATQSIVLKGVTFRTNSTELTPEAKSVLDKAYAALAGQAGLRVEVGGHTDSLGNAALNTALSQRRAEAVRSYLVSKGADAAHVTAKGYGSSQPIADNKTKEGRARNRRVELKVIR